MSACNSQSRGNSHIAPYGIELQNVAAKVGAIPILALMALNWQYLAENVGAIPIPAYTAQYWCNPAAKVGGIPIPAYILLIQ